MKRNKLVCWLTCLFLSQTFVNIDRLLPGWPVGQAVIKVRLVFWSVKDKSSLDPSKGSDTRRVRMISCRLSMKPYNTTAKLAWIGCFVAGRLNHFWQPTKLAFYELWSCLVLYIFSVDTFVLNHSVDTFILQLRVFTTASKSYCQQVFQHNQSNS